MLDMCCSLSFDLIRYKGHFGISVGATEADFQIIVLSCCSSPPVHSLASVETMVSIDLDNIIHYHPSPIPKPPYNPPHLTTFSHVPSHLPSNQPVLIHPLPPRPQCLSHEPSQTSRACRQSPSPAASFLIPDRDAHPNEFDMELANLEMAEFESQETPGPCLGGSEESQSKNINDTQSKELHDQHRGK